MRSTNLECLICLTFLTFAAAAGAYAQAPRTMSFQGFATDLSGIPIDTVGVDMAFALYSGGTSTLLWTENHTDVPVDSGVFHVILGNGTPIDVRFFNPIDLGIKVGDDPEMTPRVSLTSVPFAMGLALPSYGSAITDTTALGVIQDGTGTALEIHQSGTGAAGIFLIDEVTNEKPAVHAETNGPGIALFAQSTGDANAGVFLINNVASATPALYVETNGTGMGILTPDTIHVRSEMLGLDASERKNEELLIEATDAMIGLYSDGTGTWGSGLHFGEIVGSNLVDKWSLTRRGQSSGSSLAFRYGTSGNHETLASSLVKIDTTGDITAKSLAYSNPRSHYASIHYSAFRPSTADSSTSYGLLGGLYLIDAPANRLEASIQLPDGAVADSLACFVVDLFGTVPGSDLACSLLRYDSAANSSLVLASVATDGAPGLERKVTALFSAATIDNMKYSYQIEVAATGSWTDQRLMIRSAQVHYTLAEAQ